MNRRQGAGQGGGLSQFRQRQVRLPRQQLSHPPPVPIQNLGLTPRVMMPRPNVPSLAPLLQELLDHAQRNPVTVRYLVAGALVLIVGGQNPFSQIN